jgi:hypothetical protein
MLTIEQVIRCVEEGISIEFKKSGPKGIKGEYDPSTQRISIYVNNLGSPMDMGLTILHEFIHARDDIGSARGECAESKVEREAMLTYRNAPHVIRFIRQIYQIE